MVKVSRLVRIVLQVIEFPYIGSEKCLGVVDKSPRSPAEALAPHVLSEGERHANQPVFSRPEPLCPASDPDQTGDR
jgi:hypothetical protein